MQFYLRSVYEDQGMFDEGISEIEKSLVLNGIDGRSSPKTKGFVETMVSAIIRHLETVIEPNRTRRSRKLNTEHDDGNADRDRRALRWLGDKDQALHGLRRLMISVTFRHDEWLNVDPQ